MAHLHEKIDFTTGIYVVNGDAVLLRYHEKYHDWLHLGGHIELDEDPNEGAIREAKEEAGLDIVLVGTLPPAEAVEGPYFQHLINPRFMNMHRVKPEEEHRHCDFIYFATSPTRDLDPRAEELECEMKWFTREDLDNPEFGLLPSVKFYCQTALDELGG